MLARGSNQLGHRQLARALQPDARAEELPGGEALHLDAEYQVDPRTIDRDDAWMVEVYAGENVTQRGSNGVAEAGSVAAAVRWLAKAILTGEVSTIVDTSEPGAAPQ